MKSFVACIALILLLGPFACSQAVDAPSFGVFAGAGVEKDPDNHAAIQAGGSMEQSAPNQWIGWMFEGGYLGPVANLHGGSALFAFNYVSSWETRRAPKLFPFATAGYAQLFGTGNAADFGAGLDLRLRATFGVRLEARDYFAFPHHQHNQHNIGFRIGFRRYFED